MRSYSCIVPVLALIKEYKSSYKTLRYHFKSIKYKMVMLFFKCLFLSVGYSLAFVPGNLRLLEDWASISHKVITRIGIWSSVVDFLKDNPQHTNNINISEHMLPLFGLPEYSLVVSSKFRDAVDEIEAGNVLVDLREARLIRAHVDAEQFVAGSRRLFALKKRVIHLLKNAGDDVNKYEKAREDAGRFLHTLQDFYSHSNWIEIGNRVALPVLGDRIISRKDVAGPEEATCRNCPPSSPQNLSQTDDCSDNLILTVRKLTSGYFTGQHKPVMVGKCSHGGVLDTSRTLMATGGINKDSFARALSPHFV